MKKMILVLFTLYFIALGQVVQAAESPSADVLRAAEDGLTTFLKSPGVRNLDKLGFSNTQEVDAAVIGQGFRISILAPAKVLASVGDEHLSTLSTPSDTWQFLVLSGGIPKALLTVTLLDGSWTAVSFGAHGLAMELASVLEQWPASNFTHTLIRSYQAKSDFIELSDRGTILGVVPLISAREMMAKPLLAVRALQVGKPGDVLPSLREQVRMNLQNRS
ncbi:MAG: hypothetical protein HXX11_10710 [Desulfuromonadales bacterium]|nr:hypothetical protein [Desulfuromonadales bacterium]